jgi:hypothetical protein
MITLSTLTELLGWASILNVGMLVLATIMLVLMRPFVTSIHRKMFDISESDLSIAYFKYLASYKTFSFVFFIAPYLALKIMGQ